MQGLMAILLGLAAIGADAPTPTMTAARIEADFEPDGDLSKPAWQKATPVEVRLSLREAEPRPALATTVRCLWSPTSLYFAFRCPYTRLTVFEPVSKTERLGLWDRDVVEAFVGAEPGRIGKYGEFEVAPTNERLDVLIDQPGKDFDWDSRFTSAVRLDEAAHLWTAELRIPLASLSATPPTPGTRWRLNLYRNDRAADVFLAWSPTLTPTAHTPERFGTLTFGE
jgi:hypothetical protein